MASLAILELLETRDTSYTLKNNFKPSKEQIDHILRFSTCFVSVSARLAIECDGRMALAFV